MWRLQALLQEKICYFFREATLLHSTQADPRAEHVGSRRIIGMNCAVELPTDQGAAINYWTSKRCGMVSLVRPYGVKPRAE